MKSMLTKKAVRDVVKAPAHPIKTAAKFVLCGVAIFAVIKMIPELRRYVRIEMM
jgi:large-conductance mechanosensitive channel